MKFYNDLTGKKEEFEMYENELLLVEEINENMGDYDLNDKEYQILLENTVHHDKKDSSPDAEEHKNYEIQKLKAMSRKAPLAEDLDIIPESEDISREDTIHINSRKNSLMNSTKSSITLDVDKLKNTIDENDNNDNNKDDSDNDGSDNEKNKIDEKNYNEAF